MPIDPDEKDAETGRLRWFAQSVVRDNSIRFQVSGYGSYLATWGQASSSAIGQVGMPCFSRFMPILSERAVDNGLSLQQCWVCIVA